MLGGQHQNDESDTDLSVRGEQERQRSMLFSTYATGVSRGGQHPRKKLLQRPTSLEKARSIKGRVKRNISPATGRSGLLRCTVQPTLICEALGIFSSKGLMFFVVTTLLVFDVGKQRSCRCQPWFYLRLGACGFFWLSEGA